MEAVRCSSGSFSASGFTPTRRGPAVHKVQPRCPDCQAPELSFIPQKEASSAQFLPLLTLDSE